MDEAALDTTLQHVLDPVLQQTPDPEVTPEVDGAGAATPVSAKRAAKRPRKSAAPVDSRRKEANRLAAERSRGRQQEKVVALEVAIQSLGDENLRLREEIARLESGAAEANPVSLDLLDPPADDDHSRTLLNALLSAPPAPAAPPADDMWLESPGELNDNWMMGINDLFPGVDASGRLSELANIAAGQGSETSAFTVSAQDAAVLNDAISASNAQAAAAPSSTDTPRRTATAPQGMRSANSAIALNTEMERFILDDLVKTKEAIARIQREIAFYRGHGDPVDDDIATEMTLANDILRANDDEVRAKTTEVEGQIAELESKADVLRVVITRTRDARFEEANKLAAVVNELRALGMDGGERERERITGVLRALRGHITAVIANPGGPDGSGGFTPFSSATARRKRGRPPKNAMLAKYGLSFLSPASDGQGDSGSDHPDTPSARPRAGMHRRSRLAHELRISPDSSQQAGPSTLGEDDHGEASQAAHAHAHDDYLLSHLTDAVQGARQVPMSLDSTSFAAFLPPSPDSASHATHDLDGTLGTGDPGAAGAGSGNDTPTALSRFKRGPPGSCDICSRTQTSVWRKLNFEGEELRVCNACGLYYTKFGVPRPAELWGDGRTVKKRKASEGKTRRKRKSSKFGHDYDGDVGVVNGSHERGQSAAGVAGDVEAADAGPDGDAEDDAHAHSLNDVGRAVENMFAAAAGEQEEQ